MSKERRIDDKDLAGIAGAGTVLEHLKPGNPGGGTTPKVDPKPSYPGGPGPGPETEADSDGMSNLS